MNRITIPIFNRMLSGLLTVVLILISNITHGAKPVPSEAGSFVDNLDGYNTSIWTKADGWSNGSPFANGWQADHIDIFDAGLLTITLDDVPSSGEDYTSGEYRTIDFYGYGCYQARFKPVATLGVVTALFTFAGPFDKPRGGNGKHNEIDVEFLGNNTSEVQFNFWTNDDSYINGHEYIYSLEFDAAQDFHDYGFKWTADGIEWYVDDVVVYAVADAPSDPTVFS